MTTVVPMTPAEPEKNYVIYEFKDADGVSLYIGVSDDWDERRYRHENDGRAWITEHRTVEITKLAPGTTRRQAEEEEADQVRRKNPKYNIMYNGEPAVDLGSIRRGGSGRGGRGRSEPYEVSRMSLWFKEDRDPGVLRQLTITFSKLVIDHVAAWEAVRVRITGKHVIMMKCDTSDSGHYLLRKNYDHRRPHVELPVHKAFKAMRVGERKQIECLREIIEGDTITFYVPEQIKLVKKMM